MINVSLFATVSATNRRSEDTRLITEVHLTEVLRPLRSAFRVNVIVDHDDRQLEELTSWRHQIRSKIIEIRRTARGNRIGFRHQHQRPKSFETDQVVPRQSRRQDAEPRTQNPEPRTKSERYSPFHRG
jgi:hypothetical protein